MPLTFGILRTLVEDWFSLCRTEIVSDPGMRKLNQNYVEHSVDESYTGGGGNGNDIFIEHHRSNRNNKLFINNQFFDGLFCLII